MTNSIESYHTEFNAADPVKRYRIMREMPIEALTEEFCLHAVQQDCGLLALVPEQLRTPEMCLTAVRMNGSTLSQVPDQFKTPELCLVAVKNVQEDQWGSYALNEVPESLRTPELCLAAVRACSYAIVHVPKALLTPEMNLLAAKNCKEYVKDSNDKEVPVLKLIPAKFRTLDVCLAAVKNTDVTLKSLKLVPKKFLCEEVYFEAVKANYRALANVPEEVKTSTFCVKCLKALQARLDDIRSKNNHTEMEEYYAQEDVRLALGLIPDSVITPEMFSDMPELKERVSDYQITQQKVNQLAARLIQEAAAQQH